MYSKMSDGEIMSQYYDMMDLFMGGDEMESKLEVGETVFYKGRKGKVLEIVPLPYNTPGHQYYITYEDKDSLFDKFAYVDDKELISEKEYLEFAEDFNKNMNAPELRCQCGSYKVPGLENMHSSWCPMYKRR